MLPAYYKRYQIAALSGSPSVLMALLQYPSDSPSWDALPDPERFTLREAVAHLADWEPVARERIRKCRDEDRPFLTNWDEDQAAIDGEYATKDPHASLALFAKEREETVALISSLPEDAWARVGEREGVGDLSIERQVSLMIAHDGYHVQHAAQLIEHDRLCKK